MAPPPRRGVAQVIVRKKEGKAADKGSAVQTEGGAGEPSLLALHADGYGVGGGERRRSTRRGGGRGGDVRFG